MELNGYQKATKTTAQYPDQGEMGGLLYTVLGLTGESGEVADKVKKILRDKQGVLSPQDELDIVKELGDVLWYVSRCAEELGYTLEYVAFMNLLKLYDRKGRGKIKGSGDNR
ncbi:MAG: nucleoside triphosphate pyrophosphohydrolase family protein [Sphaerospermopsis sp. SIO1G2]|nr:nucleoside triphosphate pyrophosphohydrolase family protein [Sphaerospermopsis sp. SIO1G2]